jgi:acetolactate synthase I/II/III large subunit
VISGLLPHPERPAAVSRPVTPSERAAAAIAGALAAAGTRVVFGIPGGGPNLDVVAAAAGAGLRFVLAHGETAAAIMAATWADLTGAPGAVVVTRGPGLASAVNGIAHAALDRLPVVVIADTVPARDRQRISHQRLDQDALGRCVAKAALTLGGGPAATAAGQRCCQSDSNVPTMLLDAAERAVRLALARPAGPVVINIDPDAAGLSIAGEADAADGAFEVGGASEARGADGEARGAGSADGEARGAGGEPRGAASADGGAGGGDGRPAVAPLASALRTARRPVVLLGTGAFGHTAAVRDALVGSGIPVLHTYRARGVVPDSAGEAAGLFTGGTMEWPLLAAADLVVGLGVDPVELIPARWEYAARTLLVTDVPAGSAGYFTGGTELVAPLPAAIAVLARHRGGHRWPAAAGRAAKDQVTTALCQAPAAAPGSLTPQDVVTTVRAHTPPETVAAVDSGAHMLAVMPLWPVDEPHRLLISSGLATMGFAVPAAIAAALSAPGRPVIAFTGDGGLGMTLMEIETAVRHRLPVIVVVFNDATLSLIRIKQRPAGHGGNAAVGYGRTSFAAAAAAMGAASAPVTNRAELAGAVATALRRDGPTLIDVRVDPACYPAILDLTRGQAGRRPLEAGHGVTFRIRQEDG